MVGIREKVSKVRLSEGLKTMFCDGLLQLCFVIREPFIDLLSRIYRKCARNWFVSRIPL